MARSLQLCLWWCLLAGTAHARFFPYPSPPSHSSSPPPSPAGPNLWASPGAFGGVSPWQATNGISQTTLQTLYGPAALSRATAWVQQGKALWCGNATNPDAENLFPASGSWNASMPLNSVDQWGDLFPSKPPPVTTTNWPGACPNSAVAQQLFDVGLVWRMLFNDNEAACAFLSAASADATCAMASLGAALAMGPNVNYAFIVSDRVYQLILQSMDAARVALASPAQQLPLASALYGALLQRYCVAGPGQLAHMLALPSAQAFTLYQNTSIACEAAFINATIQLANTYPEDPNVAAIAAGALMEQPAWMWWQVGSVVAPALTDVSVAGPAAANHSSLGLISSLVKPYNAIANLILERGMGTAPDHLGLLHYMIHNLEANPEPELAQSVAERLFNLGGSSQGHAAHMRTHIDMRIGDYNAALVGNKKAIHDDADWNIARSGGGIMSVLYKYNPHNIAFVTEAAQHAGMWKEMAAAISLLNYGAGFPLVADPSQGSQVQHLMRQLLLPLRFGMYASVLQGTTLGGPGPVQGQNSNATLRIVLPSAAKSTVAHTVPCGYTCSQTRLYARTVAQARLQMATSAVASLTALVNGVCASDPAAAVNASSACSNQTGSLTDPVLRAEALGNYYAAFHEQKVLSGNTATFSLNSTGASGTLTIDNSAAVSGLNVYVPGAEVAVAQGQTDVALRLLRLAVTLQDNMFYDEPAPFFYPVAETLAGVLLKRGADGDAAEAASVLRRVLFQWPRSALSVLGLQAALAKGPNAAASASSLVQLVRAATALNDTVLSLNWL